MLWQMGRKKRNRPTQVLAHWLRQKSTRNNLPLVAHDFFSFLLLQLLLTLLLDLSWTICSSLINPCDISQLSTNLFPSKANDLTWSWSHLCNLFLTIGTCADSPAMKANQLVFVCEAAKFSFAYTAEKTWLGSAAESFDKGTISKESMNCSTLFHKTSVQPMAWPDIK